MLFMSIRDSSSIGKSPQKIKNRIRHFSIFVFHVLNTSQSSQWFIASPFCHYVQFCSHFLWAKAKGAKLHLSATQIKN